MDCYTILGVAPGASPADIKRAYRRLAMRWHPDRNADPLATERFKEIRGAYDRLLAADEEETEDSAADGTEATAETAAQPAAEESVPRAPDIRITLHLTLEEAAAGCRKTIEVVRGKPCPTCDGSGEAGLSRTRFCSNCHGSGRVHGSGRKLVACPDCGGRGLFTERICADCGGSGRETASTSLEISVPPGMLPGDDLRLSGQGEQATGQLLAGDLFLTVVIDTHPLFELHGRDLQYRMPVSALAMLAGGSIELPVLGGVLEEALAPGRPEARDRRLAGRGYPGRGRNPAGDLVVRLEPVFPRQLSAAQRRQLLKLDAALELDLASSFPEIAAWRRKSGLEADAVDD